MPVRVARGKENPGESTTSGSEPSSASGSASTTEFVSTEASSSPGSSNCAPKSAPSSAVMYGAVAPSVSAVGYHMVTMSSRSSSGTHTSGRPSSTRWSCVVPVANSPPGSGMARACWAASLFSAFAAVVVTMPAPAASAAAATVPSSARLRCRCKVELLIWVVVVG